MKSGKIMEMGNNEKMVEMGNITIKRVITLIFGVISLEFPRS